MWLPPPPPSSSWSTPSLLLLLVLPMVLNSVLCVWVCLFDRVQAIQQCVPCHMNLNLSIPFVNYNNYTPNILTSANVQMVSQISIESVIYEKYEMGKWRGKNTEKYTYLFIWICNALAFKKRWCFFAVFVVIFHKHKHK